MAAMNEVMSHRNRDPKWMAESYQPAEQVENMKHVDSQWMVNRNQKEAAATQPGKAPKTPEMPQTHFQVRLCCNKCEEKAREEAGEVPGVVSLFTYPQESRVTVLGGADPAAILKKLKKHVDKKAKHWPADVPVPNAVVSGGGGGGGGGQRVEKVGNSEKRMPGDGVKGGMKGGLDKELQGGPPGNRAANMDAGPGMNQHRVVEMMRPDPRMADPRMVDPRMVELIRGGPRRIDPRMVDPRERRGGDMRKVRFADEMPPVDPRQMRPGDVRAERRAVNPREMMGGGDVRAEMRGPAYPRDMRTAEMREGWLVDPRDARGGGGDMRVQMQPVVPRLEMRGGGGGGDMRVQVQPVVPRLEMRGGGGGGDMRELQPVNPRGMRRPIDAREMHAYEYAPRDMQPVDPRMVDFREMREDPRDYRYTGYPRESYYSSRPREADVYEYQPKDSYFSDYRPSQSYPPNEYGAAPVTFYEQGVMNPYYRN